MQILDLAVAGAWLAFWAYWFVSAARTRAAPRRRQSCGPVLLLMLIMALIWGILAEEAPQSLLEQHVVPETPGIGLLGLAVTLLGLGIAVWARVHLGRNWSARPEIKVGHTLVRTGPYRFVRNPIYTGILTGYAGTALVIGVLSAFVLIPFLLAAFLLKIRGEERLLLEEFGEDYARYRREVRALIPYIL
jgi:protein-S-isoprenylcysteine O-methyltransferase Ste14